MAHSSETGVEEFERESDDSSPRSPPLRRHSFPGFAQGYSSETEVEEFERESKDLEGILQSPRSTPVRLHSFPGAAKAHSPATGVRELERESNDSSPRSTPRRRHSFPGFAKGYSSRTGAEDSEGILQSPRSTLWQSLSFPGFAQGYSSETEGEEFERESVASSPWSPPRLSLSSPGFDMHYLSETEAEESERGSDDSSPRSLGFPMHYYSETEAEESESDDSSPRSLGFPMHYYSETEAEESESDDSSPRNAPARRHSFPGATKAHSPATGVRESERESNDSSPRSTPVRSNSFPGFATHHSSETEVEESDLHESDDSEGTLERRITRIRSILYPEFASPTSLSSPDDDDSESESEEGSRRMLGISREAVDAMPTITIDQSIDCPICLEEFAIGEEAKEMPCRHKFHRECIVPWFERNGSCPVCRFQILADDGEDSDDNDDGSGDDGEEDGDDSESESEEGSHRTLEISREAVDAMPTITIDQSIDCQICLEDFAIGEEAKEMPCRHKFHGECIVPWLAINGSCLVCRFQILADDGEDSDDNDGGSGDDGEEGSVHNGFFPASWSSVRRYSYGNESGGSSDSDDDEDNDNDNDNDDDDGVGGDYGSTIESVRKGKLVVQSPFPWSSDFLYVSLSDDSIFNPMTTSFSSALRERLSCRILGDGNFSSDARESFSWGILDDAFEGMHSEKFGGFCELDEYDTIAMRTGRNERCYKYNRYKENGVNPPGKMEVAWGEILNFTTEKTDQTASV